MNEYRLVFTCADGYTDEVTVMAVNRTMAMDCFEAFGFEDVVSLECYRVEEENEKEEKNNA